MAIVCFALSPQTRAVDPPHTPDPGKVAPTNTADGESALAGATGFYNSAFGFLALLSTGAANYNTGVGAGALLSNTEEENTAVGAATLFSNTNGGDNTAIGAFALFTNTAGDLNTAVGAFALFANTIDGSNVAIGSNALRNHITGDSNTAIGADALRTSTTGSDNIAIGNSAGIATGLGDGNIFISSIGLSGDSNTIRIGSGFQTATFIDGIVSASVDGTPVVVNGDGQLGVAPTGSPLSKNELLKQQHLVQEQEATIAQLKKDFGATVAQLTARLDEQASQIQKVSAQLEASKPAPQVVNNP